MISVMCEADNFLISEILLHLFSNHAKILELSEDSVASKAALINSIEKFGLSHALNIAIEMYRDVTKGYSIPSFLRILPD